MNLGQAYQGWQQQSQNRQLYVNTREAFRKAWLTLPTNQPCSYYTKQILGEALAATREIESNKAKAASVMIHVLTFANFAEPKFNPKPDFTLEDLMEYTRGPLANPEKTGRKQQAEDDDHDLDIDPVTAPPPPQGNGAGRVGGEAKATRPRTPSRGTDRPRDAGGRQGVARAGRCRARDGSLQS